jgi:hypothetical protein
MENTNNLTHEIDGKFFEVIKSTRLNEGMVLRSRSGDIFARLGPKQLVLEEQIHTLSLYSKGFPVAQVLSSGEMPNDQWYFTETSLGTATFHDLFKEEYKNDGQVSDVTFGQYLAVIKKYLTAQSMADNKTNVSVTEFVETLLPEERVLSNYCYFGYDADSYLEAIRVASTKLANCSMGILQFDLNPFNVLENGIIDFELVGYGPIGYDVLMSARWSSAWFTDYPSRCPVAYKLIDNQIAENDQLVSDITTKNGITDPTRFIQEFLLLKSAWALSDFNSPQDTWPKDKIAFSRYRANVLKLVVETYLADEIIDYRLLSSVTSGELE